METGDDMDFAIKRLRASRQNAREEDMMFGLKMGKQWAMETAEWPELYAVANIDFEAETDIDDLIELLVTNFNYDAGGVASFFGRDADNSLPITDAEVEGFIWGANLVRSEVDVDVDGTEAAHNAEVDKAIAAEKAAKEAQLARI